MKATDYLTDYSKKADKYLDIFFARKQKEAAKISPLAGQMMKVYREFICGKGVRGCLTKFGYECFGGKNEAAIIKASLMVEITHSFLLMHDDIMDKDMVRRGKPTIHVRYKNLHQKNYHQGEPDHYGVSMAIDLGDSGFALSHLILADSDFSSKIKVRVLRRFNRQILTTAYGQGLDLAYEMLAKLTEADILRIHHFKTANYTITGPLQYGALFAGADEKRVEVFEKYGLPVGIAFQLRDDELGIFSSQKVLGKPIGSDIKENKNTILKIKALELAKPKDRVFLKRECKAICGIFEYILGKVYSQIAAGPKPAFSIMAKNMGFLVKNMPLAGKRAEEHLGKEIEMAKEIGAKGFLGISYMDLGMFHEAKSKTDAARKCICEAIKIFEETEAEGYLKQAKEALDSLS